MHAQTFEVARDSAFGQSFVLRADSARQDGAEARLRGSADAFMPIVSLLGSQPLKSKITYNPNIPLSTYGPDITPRTAAKQYGISVDLSLFDGLQRWNTLLSSRTLVEAGRNLSIDARLQVELDTATAYLSVMRDRKILGFRRRQAASLQVIARNIEAQLAVNDATRTDTALASSRVSDAMGGIDQAVADLEASELELSRLTGMPADRLAPPRLPILPGNEAALVALVRAGNPKLAAANLDARSAQYLADAAKGALLPQVSLQFTHGRQEDVTATLHNITDTTTKLQMKIPLYEPGSVPKIAEASALAQQKGFEVEDTVMRTITAARVAFQRRMSARAQTASLVIRVNALRAAVRGYEIERGAGFRTVLDELNGRAELAQAEVLLASFEAERDRLAFVLAAMIGQLDNPTWRGTPDRPYTSSVDAQPTASLRPVRVAQRTTRASIRQVTLKQNASPIGLRASDGPPSIERIGDDLLRR